MEYYCEICQLHFTNLTMYNNHLKSPGHFLKATQAVQPIEFKQPGVPKLVGTAVMHKGLLSIEVQCPFCGRTHYHSPQPMPDYRRSHCPNIDGRTDKQREVYLKQYPQAYTGGTYFIESVIPGRFEKQLEAIKVKYEGGRK